MNDIEIARLAARQRVERGLHTFYAQHTADTRRWRLDADDEAFLRVITQGKLDDRLMMSNRGVRRSAAYACIDVLLDQFIAEPERQRVWVTMAWDSPVTWEQCPQIDTVAICNTASLHLRRSDLVGAGVVEIDTWKEIAGEPGKRMVPHVHFFGWHRHGERIDVEALAQDMCKRRALQNSLGAPSVDIKEIGRTAQDFADIGAYMTKVPAYAKNPVPNRISGKFELVQVEHAPGSVTRLIEVLSYLELGDTMFSIGEGKAIAQAVRERVRQECERGKSAPTRETTQRHWQNIRANNGNKKFRECEVITRAAERTKFETLNDWRVRK